MAAFDVTTNPPTQALTPGSTAKITVVVSNRLGKPVMGRVDGVVTPASAAGWLVAPAEPQRKFEADPAATLTFEFAIAVPATAPSTALQFHATVVDVLAPDDNRAEGQTVGVNVTAKQVAPDPGPRPGVPWWVWVVAAVVLAGAGFGIYQVVKPKGVPNVTGKSAADAVAVLSKAGFAPVTVKDTIDTEAKDTTVVNQTPEAKSDLPVDSLKGKTPAVIVVNRPPTTVPAIEGLDIALAIERLREAGLKVGDAPGQYTANIGQDNQIADVTPDAGTTVPMGAAVDLRIWAFSSTPPCSSPRCLVATKGDWATRLSRIRKATP